MAKKQLSSEMRVLLAFGLALVILLVSRPLLVRNPAPAPPTEPAPAETAPKAPAEAAAPAEPETPGTPSASETPVVPAEPVQGEAPEDVIVEGDLYRVVFSTRGAAVTSWTLKQFRDYQGHPLDLVNPEAAARYGSPLTFWMADERVRQAVNNALFVPSARGTLQAPVTLEFAYNGGGVAARKQFTFSRDSFVVEVESDLASDGKPLPHELAWRGTFGDVHDAGIRGTRWEVFYRDAQKMTRLAPRNVEGEASTATGVFAFAGIDDHFFCAAFLAPQAGASATPPGALRVSAFKDEITLPGQQTATESIGVAVGAEAPQNRLRLFVGPKQSETLRPVHPQLPELIDYGWFAVVARPLFMALRWIHDHVVGNYGWAIILLTVAINMVLFPLKISSLRSARKMQKLQPQLRAIQEKYKHLKMRDPKRQQMSQETMELYKKHGVNPIGGCLPLLLQMPFLYGFYKVLMLSIEMRQASWISWWVPDLSAPEPHWIKVLPLLMCATQFALQRMTPTPSADPTQQKIMLFMPVMFLGFFYYMSSGLVLYWLTGNLVGIAQQAYINHTEVQHQIEERRSAAERKKRPAARN